MTTWLTQAGEPRTKMGHECAAHTHRELVPIEVHHIWPLGKGGPDIASNRIPLCANAHGAVHYLLWAYEKARGEPPWQVRRQFGHAVRRLAEQGWQQYGGTGRPTGIPS